MDEEIRVEIDGKHGEIDPLAVSDAITALDKVMRSLDAATPLSARLSELKVGSAIIGIKTDLDRARLLSDGLGELATTASIPNGWNMAALSGLVELRRVGKRAGVKSLKVSIEEAIVSIDDALEGAARSILDRVTVSLGSVRGTLYRYTNDGPRRTAGLRDYRTEKSVELKFPSHLAKEVKALLDHDVTAWGEVHRDANGEMTKIAIDGIEAVPGPHPQATLDAVAGILGRDWTGQLDTVDWVRQQRD